ncbi:hypothetical protein FIBSPDRAFT_894514 [Athelia psychrophila]|uniref:Uncharacterized protein n=1 Tax=Athelia psychrophila TaxID=1759441 RepID=A0A166FSA4_9AGAM|nr:hypothetical protein FIBSPDRAFT_894514 [Fibularhizoctonia sp. CBS 109695]
MGKIPKGVWSDQGGVLNVDPVYPHLHVSISVEEHVTDDEHEDNKENVDPSERVGDWVYIQQSVHIQTPLEIEVFGGSSDLSPSVKSEDDVTWWYPSASPTPPPVRRSVSWHPRTPDPRDLTPVVSPANVFEYNSSSEEGEPYLFRTQEQWETRMREIRMQRHALERRLRNIDAGWHDTW